MTPFARLAAACALMMAGVAASGCTAPAPSATVPPAATIPASPPNRGAPSPTAAPTGWYRTTGTPTTLASGLRAPWSVVPLDDGGALLSQRDDGRVLELQPSGAVRTVGTIPDVVSGGESGLHGLALWGEGGGQWLYAYHGTSDDNRVVRMPLLGEPGSLSLGDAEVILAGIARNSTHDGGRIAFGPDRNLYIATGDAQNRPDAQDPASLNGKILRVTPEGDAVAGNPFGTAVYSLGHRNVQGLAWTSDGAMWASEFGQDTFDELNRIVPGGNYGWPVHEGVADDPEYVDPIVTWATDDASPSGIAAVGKTVFLASLRGERLWAVDTASGTLAAEPVATLVGEQGRLRDVVAAPDGSLWVLTNNTDGRGSPRAEDDLLLRVGIAPHG